MQKITAKRGFSVLLALVLLLLMGVAIRGVHWQAATTPPKGSGQNDSVYAGAKTNAARARDAIDPGSQPNNQQAVREDDLLSMEDYWNTRVTYPTGQFSTAWLLKAAEQDRLIPSGIPAGQVSYNRGASQSPLALDPARFIALGPAPEQTDGCYSCYNYGHVSGRVNDIAIDPVTPNVAYLASVGGGIWKTTNCCITTTTWVPTFDNPVVSTLAVDSIDVDPSNHNTVYVGTGDLNFGSFSMGSAGVLKSTNAGSSWAVLGSSTFAPPYPQPAGQYPQYQAIGKVRVDPRNGNNVVAGTKTGLYFSYDGGTNWSGPCLPDSYTTQRQDITGLILHNNGSSTDLYTAIGTRGFSTTVQYDLAENGANGVYKAPMPGSGCPANWTLLTTPTNGWPAGTGTGVPYHLGGDPVGRIDLALAPNNPLVMYAEAQSIQTGGGYQTGGFLGLWRTTDGGVSWNKQSGPSALTDCGGSPGDYNQNWYDQGVAIDPNDANTVFMDTFEVWKSTDGGVSFLDTTCGYSGGTTIHVDQHALAFLPGSSSVLMAGNDGGAYVTRNADVISPTLPIWNQLNDSLNTIEFYSGDTTGNFANGPNPGANGGAQDNGSSVTTWSGPGSIGSQTWQTRVGGDGFWSRTEPVLGQRWYQTNNSGHISLSNSGPYGPYTDVTGGWLADTRSFVTPSELYKYDCPNTGCTHHIVGSNRVWESITGCPAFYCTLIAVSPNLVKGTLGNRSYINQLSYAVSLSTTVIVGTNDGNVQYGFGLGQGAMGTWVDVTGGNTTLPNRPILDVTTDPVNPLIGYAAVGGFDENTPSTPGHVFQVTCTANCATFTWANKTGNLPDIPIDSIVANPRYPQQVFAGSDWGLYYTNDVTVSSPSWYHFDAGLPHVMIWDMTIDRGYTTLSVWTRSRGAYVWPLPNGPYIQPSPTPTVTGTPPTATATIPVTPSPTPSPAACFSYTTLTSTATIITGTTDIGNHCDDCATTVQLPFTVPLYDQTFSQAYATSNGAFVFGPAVASYVPVCLPDRNFHYTVLAYQNDQCTADCGGGTCSVCGIFTRTIGSAPNRQFIVEWRTIHYGTTETPNNYEIILNEGSSTITVVYGFTNDLGSGEVAGIQEDSDNFTQFTCMTAGLLPNLQVNYLRNACPTATPTHSPPTNTATLTATLTVAPVASSTPTACTVSFTDVPPGSTFYTFIRCLACKGIINGYPDGTFKPGNNVTRGQLSKIVSNSAGFNDVPTGQQFQDVPVGSTFYVYIYRLSSRGFINGYPCGAPPAGACVPPGNLPYFLPNANSTRGQISKIVSNAAGFNEVPSGQQFQDVGPNSTFYAYIYRLVLHNVMSGYPCGTPPAGQCVPPNNLPYFLPNNNATRGQTSKIVSNTFFPNCNPPEGVTK
jgi:hypothetical protein